MGHPAIWLAILTTAFASILFAILGTQDSDRQWLHWLVLIGWTIGPIAWFVKNVAVRNRQTDRDAMDPLEEQYIEEQFHKTVVILGAVTLTVLTAVYSSRRWASHVEPPQQVVTLTVEKYSEDCSIVAVSQDDASLSETFRDGAFRGDPFSDWRNNLVEGNPLRRQSQHAEFRQCADDGDRNHLRQTDPVRDPLNWDWNPTAPLYVVNDFGDSEVTFR